MAKTKGGRIKIPNEEDKSLMHKYTKQFLEVCNEKFGFKPKLKHIFKIKQNALVPQTNFDSAEFIISDLEPEFEEILSVTDIVNEGIAHVYVAFKPFVR